MMHNMTDGENDEDDHIEEARVGNIEAELEMTTLDQNHHSDDEMFNIFLQATLNEANSDDIDDLDGLSAEVSSLNNTIDEVNRFLDKWDERHEKLRAEIREILEEERSANNSNEEGVAASAGPKEVPELSDSEPKLENGACSNKSDNCLENPLRDPSPAPEENS